MRIVPVPCLADNFAYLVISRSGATVVVDPSEAEPVLAAVKREGAELRAIWNTHHHHDHVGGNQKLIAASPGLEVVGHLSDKGRIPGQTSGVNDGDSVSFADISARIIHNPGHTSGAISFYIADPGVVFTGDTLFGAGCGRLFEGTPAEMHTSLTRLAQLPETTAVYFGHEYTANNLKFAAAVEPGNKDIQKRSEHVLVLQRAGKPSVPSTMAEERATNPFLRVHVAAVAQSVTREQAPADDSPTALFAALRKWKDRF